MPATSTTPPRPRWRYPGQLLITMAQDKAAAFAAMARAGDVTQVRIGMSRLVLLMQPDDIRRVLVTEQRKFTKGWAAERGEPLVGEGLLTSKGEFHLRQRRLVQPALHRERLLSYGATMTSYTQHMLTHWEHGRRLDLHDEMMRLTLAIAGRTLFDVDVEREAQEVSELMELSLKMFRYALWPLGGFMEYVPLGWVRRLHRARRQFDALIARMIAERGGMERDDRGDLLSMLLVARDPEGDTDRMTHRQVRDEIVTLLLAGHETTAVTLSWTLYLLSQYPDIEARLHAEVDRVLGGRAPTAADAAELQYTRMILAEAMRLYPPAWIIERRAIEDFEAGGYHIPAGTEVYVSPYLVHRDPRWWSVPTRFDPERWLQARVAERPKFSYFPFGGGTRICVGEHFAWLEATLVLATIAQRWQLRYEESHVPVPEGLATLRPQNGLPMWIESR